MRILFLSSEVAPFSKSGGLGDVAGALPKALAARGHSVRVVSPRYQSVPAAGLKASGEPLTLHFPFGARTVKFFVRTESEGHVNVLVDDPDYFGNRKGIYGEGDSAYPDNHRRFAAFTMAALAWSQREGFDPDVVHLNDWQPALAAVALRTGFRGTPISRAKIVTTLHNVAYQGNFSKMLCPELGIPWSLFVPTGLEFFDQLSFLKGALVYSDALVAVSPHYAWEITTKEGGHGLDGVLRSAGKKLTGILNGVDVDEWNPATDPHLPARYSRESMAGKETCKRMLLQHFKLPPPDPSKPSAVFGSVGRFASQKGVELLQGAVPWLAEKNARLVVLGSGESKFENQWRVLAQRYPSHVGLQVGFDEALAHRIEAGCDFFVMPSQFEPCGLNQMYSLLYGTVPVVRSVGGLYDTVKDLGTPGGVGIRFEGYSVQALIDGLGRALELWNNPQELSEVRRRGMGLDLSWNVAAEKYEKVYRP